MSTIKIDYEKARASAKRLRGLGSDCSAAAQGVQKAAAGTGTSWKGDAATTFSSYISDWVKETNGIQRDIETLAAQITKAADLLEQKEKEIAAAAGSVASAITKMGSAVGDILKGVK